MEHGVKVLTTLDGRSAASRDRAAAAGMTVVPRERLVEADLVLSIVPPAAALSFAEQMAPLLGGVTRKPVFVDCNAVSPETVVRIGAVIAATGAPFVDAGIIGLPPKPGAPGPHIYASGEHASRVAELSAHGLDVRVLDGPIGAASALKMCFAGINKGLIAVASAMILAATRAGAQEALYRELAESEPALLAALERKVPGMLSKAWRWVAEMHEIAAFAGEDPATADIYKGAARFYERISRDFAQDCRETPALERFFPNTESRGPGSR